MRRLPRQSSAQASLSGTLQNCPDSHASPELNMTCASWTFASSKLQRPRSRTLLVLGLFAVSGIYGLVVFCLNASAGETFVRNLLTDQAIRTYSFNRDRVDVPLDEDTANATQLLRDFHADGPCEDGWRRKECYADTVRLAQRRQKQGFVVLLVTTRGQYDIVLNWCVSMMRIRLDNFIILALDDDSFQFLEGRRAPVVRLASTQKRIIKSDVWVKRTLATYMILRAGINVLVSDADAVAVASPFESPLSRFADPSLDIITTPSNFPNPNSLELPEECPRPTGFLAGAEWRHQPCMGWILFRSNQRMISFFEKRFLIDVIRFKDDQIGLNCAIRKAGAVWREPRKWSTAKSMLTYLRRPNLKLLMLPANYYVRNCTENKDPAHNFYGLWNFDKAYVQMYHCKGSHKQQNARNNGFWFLHEGWTNITSGPDSTFSSFLSTISVPQGYDQVQINRDTLSRLAM